LCAIFERGVATGLFNTGGKVQRLERVCRAWRTATATCGLWRAALARQFPAAAADCAACGAPVADETPGAAEARARRAWLRRNGAQSHRPMSSFLYPPYRGDDSALNVLKREYRFELNVRDASGAARLSMTCRFGGRTYSVIPDVGGCNHTTRLALHAEADAACLLALATPDGGGLYASLMAQRRMQRDAWPVPDDDDAPPDAFEAAPLFFNAPVHGCIKPDHGGYTVLSMPVQSPGNNKVDVDEYDDGYDHWLHHSALLPASDDYEHSDEDEDEDEAIERRWCRFSPHVIILLPAPQPAAAAGGARVRRLQCWLSFVTSFQSGIYETKDEEMLALLRALEYSRVM